MLSGQPSVRTVEGESCRQPPLKSQENSGFILAWHGPLGLGLRLQAGRQESLEMLSWAGQMTTNRR